jgi:hypothetical protein
MTPSLTLNALRRAIPTIAVAGLVAAEIAGLVAVFRAFAERNAASPMLLVVSATATLTLALLLLTAATIGARSRVTRRAGSDDAERVIWADRWIDVVFSEAEPPVGPLPAPAVRSLLDLRESLCGEPAEMVGSMMREYGIESRLIERLDRSAALKTVIRPRRALDHRLEAIDDLGRARTLNAVPTLLTVAADPEPATRLAGIRALARSVAAIPTERERRAVAGEVLAVLRDAPLSMGALGEAMELLGPAAVHVVAPILEHPHRYGNRMLVAALDTVARLRMDDMGSDVARYASSRRNAVRRSALHALTTLEHLPPVAASAVRTAFGDRDPAVRIEAARAAKLLEIKTAIYHLEELLCDEDWTVRRVAAMTLAGLGGAGIRTLIATSLVHGDPRARSIATQVLVESRSAAQLDFETEKVG